MRSTLILMVAVSMSGCGRDEPPNDWTKVPKIEEPDIPPPPPKSEEPVQSIKDILNSFLYDCGTKYGADVDDVNKLEYIHYGDPATTEEPNRVGVCWTWHYNDNSLYKSNITIKQMDTAIRARALLYHELGHCVLGLDHTTQESKTIMSPSMHTDAYYEQNWDKLVKDLCQKYP